MRYIGKTLQYLKKAFPRLTVVMLLPAAAFAFFVRPVGMISFLPAYARAKVYSFVDVLWLVFDRFTLRNVYPVVIVYVLTVLGAALALAYVERHFRVGKLTFRSPLKDINGDIFPVAVNIAVLLAGYFVVHFLFVCLITLLHILISGAGRATAVDVAVSSMIAVALLPLVIRLGQSMFFWAPLMLVYGYSLADAIITASAINAKAPTRIWCGLAIPTMLFAAVVGIVAVFDLPWWGNVLVNFVCYLLLFVYVSSFVMVTVFDLCNLERRDERGRFGTNLG